MPKTSDKSVSREPVATNGGDQRHKLPAIPKRYTDPNETDLEFSVMAGPQEYDIELKP